jgi:aminoglycoside phosphotransferase (APT) family kinase protein
MSAPAKDFHDIAAALHDMGLLADGEQFAIAKLAGGVSCDVFRIEMKQQAPMVVKRALPRLRVSAHWEAPPERAATEVAWLKLVAGIEPHWVPRILGEDRARNLFAMEYLPPERYPVWKARLAAGHVDMDFAGSVGAALARIHGATAGQGDVAAAFANAAQFAALRLEPYLLFTAAKHPLIAGAIRDDAARIATARIALMQGDISPKNILCGPEGPLFLDAETACYGDPAFDLAFCLNHFLLKAAWQPQWAADYGGAFAAMRDAYLDGVRWEGPAAIDQRTAKLLPLLFLARVDGKSPVEYLSDEGDRAFVRGAALQMIVEPPFNLAVLAESYFPLAAQR